ncbi:MAG TPA: MDR family oxidoreductase [Ktedonobacterales bacterium]|nr:MDR family oxidoreductase [Ktedonobacterales bacterium]
MGSEQFTAIVVDEADGQVTARQRQMARSQLPPGDVLVRVRYSSVNYKDGLALTGQGRVIRQYPGIPGLDMAGTVEESTSDQFAPGDEVVMTGCGPGESRWGCYAEVARVNADWLIERPEGLTARQAAGIGTAGFTAMMAVMALEEHGLAPGGRAVMVTGAAGGVGSVAVALLAHLGYQVTASTGRAATHDYLRQLGAHDIIDRAELAAPSTRPLESERWAGAVDSVGGATLAGVIRTLQIGACVAACGIAGGAAVPTTVQPFILRGVSLLGIDSLRVAPERRRAIWARLRRDLPLDRLDGMLRTVPLGEVIAVAPQILGGQVRGRIVVEVAGDQ